MTDKQTLLSEMRQQGGLLRKFMSKEEISEADLMVRSGQAFKGISDDRYKSVVYFAEKMGA